MADTQRVPGAPPAGGSARPGGRSVERVVNLALPLLAVLALLGLWQLIVVARDVQPFVFPRLWGDRGDTLHALGTHWPDIWAGLLVTLEEAAWGFVLANVLAIVGASIFVYSRLAERMLYPVAVVVQTIPVIVVAPILVIILPTDSLYPEVIVAFLISFFPSLVTMTNGLRAVDPLLLELFRVLNASGWQVYRKLRWPASIPFAVRVAADHQHPEPDWGDRGRVHRREWAGPGLRADLRQADDRHSPGDGDRAGDRGHRRPGVRGSGRN